MGASSQARQAAIHDALACKGFVDVASLQESFGCSVATVRRDLEQLYQTGHLRRTRGGAVLDGRRERPFTAKLGEMAEAKQSIARSAASLVEECQAIGLTGGTTTQQVARSLVPREGLTAVTNTINIAMELTGRDMRVIVTCGELRSETYELVGPLAEPVAVVADHTKLGRMTFAQIAALEAAHVLITDAGADPEMIREIERAELRVITAQA